MSELKEVGAIVRAVGALLEGSNASVQGAALADLLAIWLAGHVIVGDPGKTQKMREMMLKAHLAAMWPLVDVNYRERIEPKLNRMRQ